MPASSDTARVAIVAETVKGVIPTSPVWQEMRITGESLNFAHSSTQSNELGGSARGTRDSVLTGGAASGAIQFELHKSATMDALFGAMLGQDWGDDPLDAEPAGTDFAYVGNERKTFAIEKRLDDGAGTYYYHRYTGLIPNSLTIDIAPNEIITGSIEFIGETRAFGTAELAGATYTPAGTAPIMRAPLVTSIRLLTQQDAYVFDVQTQCFTRLSWTLQNNVRAISCIGFYGTKDSILGKFTGTINATLSYSSDFVLQATDAQTEFKLIINIRDDAGDWYEFFFPRVKFSSASAAASGSGQDVTVEATMEVLTGAGEQGYSLRISRGEAQPITYAQSIAGNAQSATVTLYDGPSDAADSVSFAFTVAGGTVPASIDVPIALAQSTAEVALAAATAINAAAGAALTAVAQGPVIQITRVGSVTITGLTITGIAAHV